MKKVSILVAALALTAALVGCSKEENASAPGAAGEKAEAQKEAPSDVGELSITLTEKMADVFADNQADCDKMASSLASFIADNKDNFKKIKEAGEKQSLEEKKAFNEKYKERVDVAMKKMTPAIDACKANTKVQEAMKTMPL